MSTSEVLLLRLARSATVSALAVSASVLAHLLSAGHAAAPRQVLLVAAVLTLADLLVAQRSQRPSTLGLRLVVLQVLVHVALAVSAVGAGGAAVGTAGPIRTGGTQLHHAGAVTTASGDLSWADLLPSAPMLLAHAVVAVLVAAALTGAGRACDVARSSCASVVVARRLVAAWCLDRVLVPPAPVSRPGATSRVVRLPVSRPARKVWLAPVWVRRGPPRPLGA